MIGVESLLEAVEENMRGHYVGFQTLVTPVLMVD